MHVRSYMFQFLLSMYMHTNICMLYAFALYLYVCLDVLTYVSMLVRTLKYIRTYFYISQLTNACMFVHVSVPIKFVHTCKKTYVLRTGRCSPILLD